MIVRMDQPRYSIVCRTENFSASFKTFISRKQKDSALYELDQYLSFRQLLQEGNGDLAKHPYYVHNLTLRLAGRSRLRNDVSFDVFYFHANQFRHVVSVSCTASLHLVQGLCISTQVTDLHFLQPSLRKLKGTVDPQVVLLKGVGEPLPQL